MEKKMANAAKCADCGSSFTGLFCAERAYEGTINDFASLGYDASDLCISCCKLLKGRIIAEKQSESLEIDKKLEIIRKSVLDDIKVVTTQHDHKFDENIKGFVSGYSTIGTGPLTEITSAWTDFFGMESTQYLNKIRTAEASAIDMAKIQALFMGANYISGARINVAEATRGNGMIMVSFSGTALVIGEPSQTVNEFFSLIKQKKEIDAYKNIIVASNESSYKQGGDQ